MTEFAPRVNESNPDPRIACVLLLDTSGSMFGSPIEELNKGFGLFCQEIKDAELAAKRAEIAVITFARLPGVSRQDVPVVRARPPDTATPDPGPAAAAPAQPASAAASSGSPNAVRVSRPNPVPRRSPLPPVTPGHAFSVHMGAHLGVMAGRRIPLQPKQPPTGDKDGR
jgi:hypothetical protein